MMSMMLHWIETPWPVHRPALPTVSPMKYASNIWLKATRHRASIGFRPTTATGYVRTHDSYRP